MAPFLLFRLMNMRIAGQTSMRLFLRIGLLIVGIVMVSACSGDAATTGDVTLPVSDVRPTFLFFYTDN
jgi:hypothetical protein